MADLTVRRLNDKAYDALKQRAEAAGLPLEAYIRRELETLALGPVIKARYAIRFYNDADGARGLIKRLRDGVIQHGWDGCSEEQQHIASRASDLIRRNGAGDREDAIWELKNVFDNVFEVPV